MFFRKDKGVYAPMAGTIIPLEDVPDEMFAEKMLGDGFAVDPSNGHIYAPVKGEVVMIFETKHAFGIKGDNGTEVLIHFGIDTVKLKGSGFDVKVSIGQKVKVGDLLCEVNLATVKEQVPSLVTPVLLTSGNSFTMVKKGQTKKGAKVLELM